MRISITGLVVFFVWRFFSFSLWAQASPEDLAEACQRAVQAKGFQPGQVGLVVLDQKGEAWVAINEDRPFQPASNQKILVAVAALNKLGAGYNYETVLWSDQAPAGGILKGPLVVTGSGDPNISARFSNGDPAAIFRQWAGALKAAGVARIAGDLLIDDFRFDDQRFLPYWKKDQASRWYSAQVGALNLNDNCVDVTVTATRAGSPAGYRLSPATAYVAVENKCLTSSEGRTVIRLERAPGTNRVLLDGRIPVKTREWSDSVTVDDPGLYFGTVLKEVLAAEGVAVEGKVARDRGRLPDPAKRVVLHKHLSPLQRDLPMILQNSQNLHAEVLLKALGAASGKTGSVATGAEAIHAFLKDSKVPAPGLEIGDGSGYSTANRVAPITLARLLHWVSQREVFPMFQGSLSVAGESGTLKKRFRRTALAGNLFAKTGYIAGVSTLSGFLRLPPEGAAAARKAGRSDAAAGGAERPPPGKEVWVFALMINGFPKNGGLSAAHQLQETIGLKILDAMAKSAVKP